MIWHDADGCPFEKQGQEGERVSQAWSVGLGGEPHVSWKVKSLGCRYQQVTKGEKSGWSSMKMETVVSTCMKQGRPPKGWGLTAIFAPVSVECLLFFLSFFFLVLNGLC